MTAILLAATGAVALIFLAETLALFPKGTIR